MKRQLVVLSFVVSAWLAHPTPADAQVDLKIVNGRVWLVATNATVAQILNEWARIGGTLITNAERVPGAPLTLELSDVTEQEALGVVLQSAAGFMAVRRVGPAPAVSAFDRILILPTSTVPPDLSSSQPPPEAEQSAGFGEPELSPAAISDVQPVLGPDGRPVADDQQDFGEQQLPAMPMPSGFVPPVDDVNVPPYPEPPAEPESSPASVPVQPVGVPFPGMVPPPPDPNPASDSR